ncbi:MAG TPA: hypothetical protein VLQ90_08720 [Pyrinomonadaceae bacterium]|nr:hypothetical protein [Pyrinomonadaceae bacterium]
MELVGEEKKIQALFSELRLADEQAAPSFAGVWNREQLRPRTRVSPLNFSFAATAFAVCVAVFALALWSSSRQQTAPPNQTAAVMPATSPFTPATSPVTPPPTTGPTPKVISAAEQRHAARNLRAIRVAARQRAELLAARRAEIRDATAISSWQSPTATLLSSQNDALLNSLPQLNESVKELKSFLPNK